MKKRKSGQSQKAKKSTEKTQYKKQITRSNLLRNSKITK